MSDPDQQARDERLTELCGRYYHYFVRYVAARLSGHGLDRRAAAEDIVSRTLAQVMAHDPTGSVSALAAYWRTSVDHELSNDHRHAEVVSRNEQAIAYEQQGEGEYPSPESLSMDEEQARFLQETTESLPAKLRLAFRLKVWDGLSTKEIVARFAAQGVTVSERQVSRYVADARGVVERALAAYRNPNEDGVK